MRSATLTTAGILFFGVQMFVMFAGISYGVLELDHPARARFAWWFMGVLVLGSMSAVLGLNKLGVTLVRPDSAPVVQVEVWVTPSMKSAVVVCWLAVVASSAMLFSAWSALESCLDRGGSFNYVDSSCDFLRSHPYADADLFALPAFYVWLAAVVVALGVSIVSRSLACGQAK